jgi:hypothetical protein
MSERNIAVIACLLCIALICICSRVRKSCVVMMLLFLFCLGLTFSPLDITIRKSQVYQVKILPIVVTHGMYKHIEEREKQGQRINNDFVVYRCSQGIKFTLPRYALVIFIP